MIIEYNRIVPTIGRNVFIAPTAIVIGDVTIGDGASIWFNTVLRGDMAPIRIGADTNIQDNCTVHTDYGKPANVGEQVTVGHNAVIHGCTIEAGSLVRVTSRTGSIQLPVDITEDIMPGVVCMPHLWGHGRKNTQQSVANGNPGVSMNDLTDVKYHDQLTGNAIVNGVPVRVEALAVDADRQEAHEDELIEEFVA